jgi:hypothetical protein
VNIASRMCHNGAVPMDVKKSTRRHHCQCRGGQVAPNQKSTGCCLSHQVCRCSQQTACRQKLGRLDWRMATALIYNGNACAQL